MRGPADHQRHGPRAAQAGHGQRHEGNILIGVDGLCGAGRRKQHAKTDDADDKPPGQTQPRNGDAEEIEDRRADKEADTEGAEQVDRGQIDLATHVFARHSLAQPKQQGGRGGGVDHRQQPENAEKNYLEKHIVQTAKI